MLMIHSMYVIKLEIGADWFSFENFTRNVYVYNRGNVMCVYV